MKTAVSIPDEVYERAERLARRTRKSRSRLFSDALKEAGLWQCPFSDWALRTVKEYNEKSEYIHLNPVKAGLVSRAQTWPWSSVREYSGASAREPGKPQT